MLLSYGKTVLDIPVFRTLLVHVIQKRNGSISWSKSKLIAAQYLQESSVGVSNCDLQLTIYSFTIYKIKSVKPCIGLDEIYYFQ